MKIKACFFNIQAPQDLQKPRALLMVINIQARQAYKF